eukprot:2612375-Alexandrium_andersonii.AAC.1
MPGEFREAPCDVDERLGSAGQFRMASGGLGEAPTAIVSRAPWHHARAAPCMQESARGAGRCLQRAA